MHPNPAFREADTEANLRFAAARGFGMLAVNGQDGPICAHVPFLLAADGSSLDLHLARSNAIIRAGLPASAVMAVPGPDGYISPDWYGVADQVPTWNYIAVHLRGMLEPLPDTTLRAHVEAMSDRFEAELLPKPVWRTSKMGEGVMDRMMRMILPFRLRITTVDGTWKLGQNKPETARIGAADGLDARGAVELARLMRAAGA